MIYLHDVYVKILGSIAHTSTLVNFNAYLLTKFNMATFGHIGEVICLVSYTIFMRNTVPLKLMISVCRIHLRRYFHHLDQFSCLLRPTYRI